MTFNISKLQSQLVFDIKRLQETKIETDYVGGQYIVIIDGVRNATADLGEAKGWIDQYAS